jgi:hypothetical protein
MEEKQRLPFARFNVVDVDAVSVSIATFALSTGSLFCSHVHALLSPCNPDSLLRAYA